MSATPFTFIPDLSLAALVAWMRGRSPSEGYDYTKGSDCLLARFVHAQGYPAAVCCPYEVRSFNGFNATVVKLPRMLDDVSRGPSHVMRTPNPEWTIDAALRRALAIDPSLAVPGAQP